MKRFTLFVFLLCVSGSAARAQVYFTYPGAPVLDRQALIIGPFVAAGDNDIFRAAGFGRLGITQHTDVGVEVMVQNFANATMFGIGGDVKVSVFPQTRALPFDLSMNAGIGISSGDDLSVLDVPFGIVASSPYEFASGRDFTPFLGVYLVIEHTTIKRSLLADISDTDLEVELRGGLEYGLQSGPNVFGAIHLGRDALLTVGLIIDL